MKNQVVILSIQAIGQANQEIRTVQIMTIHIPNQIQSFSHQLLSHFESKQL